MSKLKELYHILKNTTNDADKRHFYKSHNILLGEQTVIGRGCHIGEYTYIGDYTTARQDVTIGRYTSIGEYCIIGPNEHRTKFISTCYWIYKDSIEPKNYYNGDDNKLSGGTIIGNDVWIGSHTTIRRGVHIGDGVIIGANSFVNNDVPDFAIFAGNPAKALRYRFSKSMQNDIKSSAWWNHDLSEARIIIFELEKKYGIQFNSIKP